MQEKKALLHHTNNQIRKALIFITFLIILLANQGYAQYDNIWAFGYGAGINFNTNPPTAYKTNIATGEGSASICDDNGNLLFYTDGDTVWNRYHRVMPNGVDLAGLSKNITMSASQGTLILPIPGRPSLYYIFSLGAIESGFLGRLSYSIVDMKLNKDSGDIVATSKSIVLDSNLTEHMTAVSGTNCDIWLMVISRLTGDIKAFNISRNGISTQPTISAKILAGLFNSFYGTLDVSPNRKKIAFAASPSVVLCDFDASSGSVSNPSTISLSAYGVSFSPDNSKLYATDLTNTWQYNLSLSNIANIRASQFKVNTRGSASSIRRAPDGKIYIARSGSFLSVINKPNLLGADCAYEHNSFDLKEGFSSSGLPNVAIMVKHQKHYTSRTDTVVCSNNTTFSATNHYGINYQWQDGSTGKTFTTTGDTSGTYRVTYHNVDECADYVDTFHLIYYKEKMINSVTELHGLCLTDTLLLRATIAYASNYTWNDGRSSIEKVARSAGIYWVNYRIDSLCEVYTDTFLVNYPSENEELSYIADTIACVSTPLLFLNMSGESFNRFVWTFGDEHISTSLHPNHVFSEAGVYKVKLIGWIDEKCADSVEKTIIVDSPFSISLNINRDSICQGESIHIQYSKDSTLIQYHWTLNGVYAFLTNNTYLHQAFDKAGLQVLTLTAQLRACPDQQQTQYVFVAPTPQVQLAKDTFLCLHGHPITITNLVQPEPGDQYLWSTGQLEPTLLVQHPGPYQLTVTNRYGCSGTENIVVHKDCHTDIPNVFSPNGDGINDYFFPRQHLSSAVTAIHFQVWNRWGRLLFESRTPDGRGWDGQFNGQKQPPAVYIYRIQLAYADGKTELLTGNVTLLR